MLKILVFHGAENIGSNIDGRNWGKPSVWLTSTGMVTVLM